MLIMEDSQLLRLILDSIPVAVLTMDHDFKITCFNRQAEKLTGYPADEAIGRPCHEILQSNRCENGCPLQMTKCSMESTMGLEAEIINRSGEYIPGRIGAVAIENHDNDFISYLEIIEDVSRQKKMEREKNNFISMIAHDMKSPLLGISGLINRLKQTCKTDEKLQEYLRIIGQAEERLESMVREFLEYSRLESGQMRLELGTTDVRRVLQLAMEMYQLRAEEQSLALTCDSKPLAAIEADESRLHRVFSNLIDNAIKYSPQEGEISISTKETDQEIVIHFKDQGWGIEPEAIPYIFDAFYRAEQKTKSAGHGLGLAAADSIIRQHGGRITVESKPGKGSVFTVRLPKRIKHNCLQLQKSWKS